MVRLASRRSFLRTAGIAGAAGALTACGAAGTPQVVEKVVTQVVEREVTTIVEGTPQIVKETVVVEKVVEATPAPAEVVTIRFSSVGWGGWLSEPWNAIVADFNESQSAVRVPEYEDVAEGYQKVMASAAGNVAADVYMFENKYMPGFASRGFFLPLDEYVAASSMVNPDDFFPNDWEESFFRGKQYLVPFDPAPYQIGINIGAFEEAGVDLPPKHYGEWTWEDFLTTAQALTTGEGANKVFGWTNPAGYMVLPWIWSNGGWFLTEDKTQCVVDSPEAIEALQWAADLTIKHNVSPLPEQLAEGGAAGMFYSGRIAMHHTAPWTTIDLKKAMEESGLRWDIVPYPDGAAGAFVRAPVDSWGIWLGSPNRRQAWEFIEFLVSDESQVKLVQSGLLTSKKAIAYSDAFLKQEPQDVNWGLFLEALESHVKPHPDTAIFAQMMDAFNPVWQAILAGDTTPAEAMPGVAAEVNALLDECRAQGNCD